MLLLNSKKNTHTNFFSLYVYWPFCRSDQQQQQKKFFFINFLCFRFGFIFYLIYKYIVIWRVDGIHWMNIQNILEINIIGSIHHHQSTDSHCNWIIYLMINNYKPNFKSLVIRILDHTCIWFFITYKSTILCILSYY